MNFCILYIIHYTINPPPLFLLSRWAGIVLLVNQGLDGMFYIIWSHQWCFEWTVLLFWFVLFLHFFKKAWINKTEKLTGSVIPLIQMPKWSWNKPMWNWAYLGVNLISLGIVDWINWYHFSICTIHYLTLTKVNVLWEQDHPGLAGRWRFGLVLLMSGKEPGLYCEISFSVVHHLNPCSSLSR